MQNDQQLTTPKPRQSTIKDLLSGPEFRQQVAITLPKHLQPDRFVGMALGALRKTPKLSECTQASFFKCLLELSALGIEADGRRAHLIPFNNKIKGQNGEPDKWQLECQLIVDWKGLVELAKRSGDVLNWRSELVCEKDFFTWVDGTIRHEINWREDRGAVQCVYSQVTLPNGVIDNEIMGIADVQAVRRRSRAADSGPWESDPGEMTRKTVVRRHSKRLTLSPEFHQATEADFDSLPRAEGRIVQPAAIMPFPTAPLPISSPTDAFQNPPPPTGISVAGAGPCEMIGNTITDSSPPAEPGATPKRRPGRPPKAQTTAETVASGMRQEDEAAADYARRHPEPPPMTPLENTLETNKEALERRINEARLDRFLVTDWMQKNDFDGTLTEEGYGQVLELWELLVAFCKEETAS